MHKTFVILLALSFSFIEGCGCLNVDPGYTGVITDKVGQGRGRVWEVGTGWHFLGWGEEGVTFPNYAQRAIWTQDAEGDDDQIDEAIVVNSSDPLTLKIDVGFNYMVDPRPGCSRALYIRYRRPIDEVTQGELRDIVRDQLNDASNRRDAVAIMTSQRDQVQHEAAEGIQRALNSIASVRDTSGTTFPCFRVSNLYITRINAPEQVTQAIQARARAAQRAQEARADLERVQYNAQADSIRATQEARRNQVLTESLTPTYLEYMRIQNESQAVAKWNGQSPRVIMGSGGGNGMSFLMQLPTE